MDFTNLLNGAFLIGLMAAGVRLATPLLFAAIGEVYAERSGVINLGIEGIMLVGAFVGLWVTQATHSLAWGILAAVLVGCAMGLIMAFMTVTLRADQIVSSIAMLLIGSGLSIYLYRVVYGAQAQVPRVARLEPVPIPLLDQIPILGPLFFQQNILVYALMIIMGVAAVVLFRTPIGLRIRAVGEQPRAADSLGVDVAWIRYFCVVFGGIMAALAGAYLTVAELGFYTDNVTGGRGFIAVALVVFGQWSPLRVAAGGLLFGLVDALQIRLQVAGSTVPFQFMVMLPYLLTILALIVVARRGNAPAALGIPYVRGER